MSNPYPARFEQLYAEADGPILDCGSGGRKLPGVTALEITHHPNNTVTADGTALPFADESFALVLSQAVLEHVAEPQRYVDECVRVLRPGGLLWIEAAFLQPVHQAPNNFQCSTPFGLAYLCRALDILEQGTTGSWADEWEWLLRESGGHQSLSTRERAEMARLVAKLARGMTPAQKHNTASGVSLLGSKR